ncbi:uncharacterized protein LOC123197487 [Mangifera indica]|uniref:uncharacterized protein LOC123197487 n=1 Tax=Mangifera indica TaxID=29780 RepID=UPI001CF964A5|nr:uncharacterized protein LOC123197487 [Mangifera indica]
MELTAKPFYGSLQRYWRRRRYQRLNGEATIRKNVRLARFHGGSSSRRFWRIKLVPKLRLKVVRSVASKPFKLWRILKNGYVGMMINFSGKVGFLNNEDRFARKGITNTKPGKNGVVYSYDEVENRVIYELYQVLMATGKLSTVLNQLQ